VKKRKRRVIRKKHITNNSFQSFGDTFNESRKSAAYKIKQLPPNKSSLPFYMEVYNEIFGYEKIIIDSQARKSKVSRVLKELLGLD